MSSSQQKQATITSLHPEPSTSSSFLNPSVNKEAKNDEEDELDLERKMCEVVGAEEFLDKSGVYMLPYQKQIFLDLVYSDALVVCAKGISYNSVIINLLRAYCDPANLVLVINAADYEEKYFKSKMEAHYIHESSTNANERQLVYLQGGIQFLTTRILVVDLLKQRIPIELITGIIILRAHQIIESCQEAFALRLYRQKNKTGFIKAFTYAAESFTYGYGHVEKVMRNIFVKELYIWPRFHITVQQSLKPYEPQVIELHIPMTTKMSLIQNHILDIMNYLVKEIKRINRYVDMQEITVENCITKKFHKILQAQLDSVWHQLSSQTKLLISDLKVLRSLMISVIYSDSVSMYVNTKKYRNSTYANNSSGWVFLDAAEQVFKISKERVYNSKDEFEPELCPKWKALSEILRVEIPSDIKRSIDRRPNILNEPIKVLILCQDSRTCSQLNQYLLQGGERHLFYQAVRNDLDVSKLANSFQIVKESDANAVRIENAAVFKTKENPAIQTKSISSEPVKATTSKASLPTAEPSIKKMFIRDRIARKKEIEEAELGTEENESDEKNELFVRDDHVDDDLFRDSYILTMTQITQSKDQEESFRNEDDVFDVTQMADVAFESFVELENLDVTQILNTTTKPIVCIQTFKNYEDGLMSLEQTLNGMDPGYIIMYHCNVTAIRQIETYEAMKRRQPHKRLKVFFLIHAQTVEEQSYLTTLRREKQAFEFLIETKSKMVVPEYQDGKSDELMLMMKTTVAEDSRKAGGQNVVKATPKIVVDMREFRSDLPCLIHKRCIEVVPIGDYILTPDICVERKSVSDLIGSLNSGRLYNQCVQMTRHYLKPILLIEFDQNKPFHLQGHYMISGESMSNADIVQKLQLLTICFPKLRIVWSPSPYATAQLFEELKQNRDEPDPVKAASFGCSENTKELESIVDKINPTIHDFLMKLPGINSRNVHTLMKRVTNMKALLKLSEAEIADILNSENNAKMLYDILHTSHKPVSSDTANDKKGQFKFKRFGIRR
ncbi:DNA repair endonuclease XPF [Pseudolycoriella hygida]|uniref:DNA repair endonuclease XPF n=1 Tax=Pseudolycoriella hygida TaxID=35572 RepID=A0A9Q0N8D1_9DIPT|nr:DNA repair endonuclease XPF [Pseudolycoriella hygida]